MAKFPSTIVGFDIASVARPAFKSTSSPPSQLPVHARVPQSCMVCIAVVFVWAVHPGLPPTLSCTQISGGISDVMLLKCGWINTLANVLCTCAMWDTRYGLDAHRACHQ